MLAGLLYLGSGVGLGCFRLVRALGGRVSREAPLRRADWPWLTAAIVVGGVVGPVLLMFGLAGGLASEASLLLNLESVLTAALAWLVFREHVHARIGTGMLLITAGARFYWRGRGMACASIPASCSWPAPAWHGRWTTI
jgi:drug/metabolite transporter (DMT)-like permease